MPARGAAPELRYQRVGSTVFTDHRPRWQAIREDRLNQAWRRETPGERRLVALFHFGALLARFIEWLTRFAEKWWLPVPWPPILEGMNTCKNQWMFALLVTAGCIGAFAADGQGVVENSLQVSTATPTTLSVAPGSGNKVQISWPTPVSGTGALLASTNVSGPWNSAGLSVIALGGRSSVRDTVGGGAKFYRLAEGWVQRASSKYAGSSASVVIGGAIYSFSGNEASIHMEVYDPAADTWTEKPHPSIPRIFYSVVAVSNRIYMVGGAIDAALTAIERMESYDPATGAWTQKASMHEKRMGNFVVVVQGKIYAVSGRSIEEYDPQKDVWTVKCNNLMVRDGVGVAAFQDKIYVVGGKTADATRALADVEEYDPATGQLTKRAALRSPVCFPHMEVVADRLYLLWGTEADGCAGTGSVQAYDSSKNVWENKSPLPVPRADIQTKTVDGKAYLVGGWLDGKYVDLVQEYDPVGDRWSAKAPLPQPMNYFNLVGLGEKLYVFGGKGSNEVDLRTMYVYDIARNR